MFRLAICRTWLPCRLIAVAGLGALMLLGQVAREPAKRSWILKSGSIEYRLSEQDGAVSFVYLGPAGNSSWESSKARVRSAGTEKRTTVVRSDIAGMIDGQFLSPEDLSLVSAVTRTPAPDCSALALRFKHRLLPLEIEAGYTAWGDTGVFTRQLTLINKGGRALQMESAPSLAWRLPPGDYSLDYLHKQGPSGGERELVTEPLTVGAKSFISRSGRSTGSYSPWFSVRNRELGVRYAAQLAYSGNWQMIFERRVESRRAAYETQDLGVELGMRFDFGGSAPLKPDASFSLLPVAFTASAGDLDDIANQFHRYQRRYVVPHIPGNQPMPLQFNSWAPLGRNPKVSDIKKYVDFAAEFGFEVFATDASWFVRKDGNAIYGDWEADPVGFPNGLKDLSDYVHAKGMKFGVWLEPESVSTESRVAREHPGWILRYNGVPMQGTRTRVPLNFGVAEVGPWVRAVVDRLVRQDKIDWLKLDYNADVGEAFDPPGAGRSGTVLYDHLKNYQAWLQQIRKDYPDLILENCSSGGLRSDLAMLAQTHLSFVSDVQEARSSVQLAYGCTLEFAPETCFHWMRGDETDSSVDLKSPPGWWDFLLRVHMNGPFGITSRVFAWSPELRNRAAENLALYKRVRSIIPGSDVYHLTPPPASGENPTGWMALQYALPNQRRSLLMAYRLGTSEPRQTFRLRGLNPEFKYRLSEDDRPRGLITGAQLATAGLPLKLDAEWRAIIVELTAQ